MSGYRTPPDFPARIVRYRITSRLATVGWTLFGAVFGVLFIGIGLAPQAPAPRSLWALIWIASSSVWLLPAALFRSGADLTIDRTHATVSVVVRGLSWKSRRKQFPLAQVKGAVVEIDEGGEHCQLALVIEGEAPFALSMEKPSDGARAERAAEEIRSALET
jgi:hypothetical protein